MASGNNKSIIDAVMYIPPLCRTDKFIVSYRRVVK